MTKADAGRLGGTVTLQRYGRDQLATWGKHGGRPRSQTYDDIMTRRLSEQNNHNKEVMGSLGNLRQQRKEYAVRYGSNGVTSIEQAGIAQVTPRGQVPARTVLGIAYNQGYKIGQEQAHRFYRMMFAGQTEITISN